MILTYTVVSLVTDRADFELSFGDAIQICGANAQLTFSDALGNGQAVDDWDLSTMEPAVSSDSDATIWRFGFRHITFADQSTIWYLRLPLIIPLVVLAVLFGVSFYGIRRKKRVAAAHAMAAGRNPCEMASTETTLLQ